MLIGIIDKNDLIGDTSFKWYAKAKEFILILILSLVNAIQK